MKRSRIVAAALLCLAGMALGEPAAFGQHGFQLLPHLFAFLGALDQTGKRGFVLRAQGVHDT